jgi:UPF0042 nucleotide-binding protein
MLIHEVDDWFYQIIPKAMKPLIRQELYNTINRWSGEWHRQRNKTKPLAENCPSLSITVISFGYHKSGLAPRGEDGGGFVFDCRGIENPGTRPDMATKTGLDPDVQRFLECETTMTKYLNAVWQLLTTALQQHRRRGHTRMHIAFGCTGGQHRTQGSP